MFMQDANAALEWDRLMHEGRFADAWSLYDDVLARAMPHDCSRPRHLQIVWTGAPFAGKRVLVRCYHGLGDTIQFVRFAAALRKIAAEVTVWAQPELLPLIAEMDGVDRVEPLTDGVPVTPYDVDVEIMELAHALRMEPGETAHTVPYIHPVTSCPAETAAMLAACGTALRVGIAWRGGGWDRERDISPTLVARLARIPGVRLFSFQPGAAAEAQSMGAADLGHLNVVEIAAVLPELDLVIGADTMLAHLAGAMGRLTWTLLPARCDWRWMNTRSDTPWYPTMRLFRQQEPGEQSAVIEAVEAALQSEATFRIRSRPENTPSCGGGPHMRPFSCNGTEQAER